ncbi:MAG: SufS family cysteine desulfurase [archaeon]|jgi:cysteine desulfurase/selenocysteine lyase
MNVNKIREDFIVLNRKVNGNKLVYLDSAATSLKPKQVLDAEKKYYETSCANIHRGVHEMSQEASIEYEKSHSVVANFINADKEEVIFTKNTTESLNLLMYSLSNGNFFKKGDKIVTSDLEHHSNIIPWQYLEKKLGIKLEFVKLTNNFEIDLEDFEKKSKGAKLVSISGASNTVSTHTNLKEIEKITHENNALLCVDGAQLVPHETFDFKKSNIDFLAFSGHKMLAPTGIGCMIGKKKLLSEMEPFLFGGDMITDVQKHSATWNNLPSKFEAGTPNIAASYGMNAAIKYLEKLGMNNVKKHEQKLTNLCISELEKMNVTTYGPKNENQGGIVLFDCKKINCHDIATILNDEGIAIRSGMHCAQPLVSSLNEDGLARASFYIYNTEDEVMFFIKKLKELIGNI